MFDFSFGELGLIVFVALIIVGPKDLPVLMYKIGRWFGQFKIISDEFRSGFKSAINEAGLANVEKDIHEINEEISYIKDDNGNLQPVYDISEFIEKSQMKKIEGDKNDKS
ncbi:MAG: hypothetical protein WCJ33_04460 [Pseudomonadota bacterium]